MSLFQKAVKSESKLRMAISGPSGSGKTYTSLAIATALANGGPIAVVDTEHGSASKYADIFAFDVANMHAPFHPDKFIAALHDAEQAGYAVIILDSISHAWSGTGGVLDIVDEAAKRSKSGNTYMAWKEGTPVQNQLVDAIVQSGIHVIATMRSKTEYVLVDTGNGKQAPRKMGMAPVQRDQFEYEFDVVLDMDVDNNAIVTKTRCPALTGKVFPKPGADVADILRSWLAGAPAPEPRPAKAAKPVATPQPPQPTAPPTEAIEQTGEADGIEGDSIQPHEWAYSKLAGNCRKFADWCRTKHADSRGPATQPMYQFLAGVLDGIIGNTTHKEIMAVLVGRPVTSDNPPGYDLVSQLLDWLPETTGKGNEKIANPNHKPQYIGCIQSIAALVLEAQGQASLFA
jgi:hypothetical protein